MRSVLDIKPGDIVRYVGHPYQSRFLTPMKPGTFGKVVAVQHAGRYPVINVEGTWVHRSTVEPSSQEEWDNMASWERNYRQEQIQYHRQAIRFLESEYQ